MMDGWKVKDGAMLASPDAVSHRSVTHHTTIYIKMHRHMDDPELGLQFPLPRCGDTEVMFLA